MKGADADAAKLGGTAGATVEKIKPGALFDLLIDVDEPAAESAALPPGLPLIRMDVKEDEADWSPDAAELGDDAKATVEEDLQPDDNTDVGTKASAEYTDEAMVERRSAPNGLHYTWQEFLDWYDFAFTQWSQGMPEDLSMWEDGGGRRKIDWCGSV